MRRFDLTISQNMARVAVVGTYSCFFVAMLALFDLPGWLASVLIFGFPAAAMWWAMGHLTIRDRAPYECTFVSKSCRIVVSADVENPDAQAVIQCLVEHLKNRGHEVVFDGVQQ